MSLRAAPRAGRLAVVSDLSGKPFPRKKFLFTAVLWEFS